jgi:hypothetical protein
MYAFLSVAKMLNRNYVIHWAGFQFDYVFN